MRALTDPFLDRLAGSLVGLLAGDALGMPVEGWPWERIEARFGWLEEMLPGRLPRGSYTDDGQMALGLLESLIAAKGFDPALCAERWLKNYQPSRGYGGRIHGLMGRLAQGVPFDQVATDSWGNGAAMRVAPLGVWFCADEAKLIKAALAQAAITHGHAEAQAGALAVALAAGLAARAGLEGKKLNPGRVIDRLAAAVETIDTPLAQRIKSLKNIKKAPLTDLRAALSELFDCGVRTRESVPPALAAFLLTDSLAEAVCLAVNLGGDTDTLAAMAGGLAGAYRGLAGVPEAWWLALENAPGRGRDHAVGLCLQAGAGPAFNPSA